MASSIDIEVVYALPNEQTLLGLSINQEISVIEAVKLSGILEKYPEICLTTCSIGIYGKRLANIDQYALQAGDRIEIYRPLQIDPKEARRKRAEKVVDKKA